MVNKILIGVVLLGVLGLLTFFVYTFEGPDPLEGDPVEIAEEWVINNAATFTERGGGDLEFVASQEEDDNLYEVEFNFLSAFAGYGPVEDDEMAAQVQTPHEIVVTVEEGEVIRAVTDGIYDEMAQEFIEEEPGEGMISMEIYFYVVEDGMESLASVVREMPIPQEKHVTALNELLEGPSEEERAEGYATAIDEETTLLDFYVEDNVGFADFSEELDASGSATVTLIRDQITSTLLQFEELEEVVISIEGETEEILQP